MITGVSDYYFDFKTILTAIKRIKSEDKDIICQMSDYE